MEEEEHEFLYDQLALHLNTQVSVCVRACIVQHNISLAEEYDLMKRKIQENKVIHYKKQRNNTGVYINNDIVTQISDGQIITFPWSIDC